MIFRHSPPDERCSNRKVTLNPIPCSNNQPELAEIFSEFRFSKLNLFFVLVRCANRFVKTANMEFEPISLAASPKLSPKSIPTANTSGRQHLLCQHAGEIQMRKYKQKQKLNSDKYKIQLVSDSITCCVH